MNFVKFFVDKKQEKCVDYCVDIGIFQLLEIL